jgi:nitrogen regulatory protein PII
LGIKSQKKEIVNILLEKEKAKEVLDYFAKEFQLHEPGHGIAYTTPVIAAGQIINNEQSTWNKVQDMEAESMFKKLTVVVNRGMAGDVMDIARRSGVKGGTILHGRGTGSEVTAKFFGMEIEPEKELVMILLKSDLLDKVVNDLYQELQLGIPGNGILFVEPILDVRGLFDSYRNNKDT